MHWGTLAIALQIPFNPPDEALPEVLEHLQRPDFTLEVCAEWLRTDLPSLCAFLTSDRGLALLAHTELAQAIHIRAIAIARLPHVIDAMTYALQDFANTCRNVPLNPKSMQSLEFVERAKETARKNGQLLLRLAHFSPRPLRSYARPSDSPSQREGAGGWVSSTFNLATTAQTTPRPSALTSPERQRVGPAVTNTTPQPTPHPTPQPTPKPTPTHGTTPPPLACPTPASTPVPLTISAAPRSELRTPRFHPSDIPHPNSRPPPALQVLA